MTDMSRIEQLKPQTPMLIGGEWVEAVDGGWIEVENPSRGVVLSAVPAGGPADVERAVAAAEAAFPAWRSLPARTRGEMLWRIGDAVAAEAESLAVLVASETGNALRTQARGEIAGAADFLRYYGGVSSEQKGETLPLGDTTLNYTTREPYGVVGAIVPWNAPVVLASLKIGAALMTGNVIVLKAAEDAPLGVLALAEICQRFLPPGVLNVLTGTGEECGAAITAHPGIAKLTFTGSSEVGRVVAVAGAERIVPVTLELGGKNPTIVFSDSDDDETADGVIAAMRVTRQGQSCTAGSRLYVHQDIFEPFVARVVSKLEALRIGDALDESTDMGAIVSRKQFDQVSSYIEDGINAGGSLLTGGLPRDSQLPADGYFVAPTVFTDVGRDWRISREEVFGPVLVIAPWSDTEEVIAQANDSHYGLAAYVWSKDARNALRTSQRLEAGWVQINRGGGQPTGMSYGGIKKSGLGREFSLEGALDSFTYRKTVTIGI